ncbi:hypothetical protein NQ038_02750 [Brevibacterium sp. 50QC2O2]|jgi:hypothetical protein|uniref:hypothetical protein n=1 Tax=Brevibacterium TaxID=1696 RepID=UPI00211C5D8A|nr:MULTISPECIES: hypothetical protein [unclassified Brevibacterium]MCQ9368306.1 hypothetical protein [Brevibacterium sp. 91QC2O2]MCQ9384808.1 hypothetical protein [Brevibacterium sp. 68QC2CO]MCQ9387570.1 hypothetical protein [Brevibacterium sp. 50QC2O2]
MPRSSNSRRKNKWQRETHELGISLNSIRHVVEGPDGEWVVQSVRGNSSGKVYTCPGCNQDLPAGTPHTVAWRSEDEFGVGVGLAHRRHWHTSCFNARHRRR